jgi:hypothetical protein
MNLGGAPNSKRAYTLLREREIREEADPALKEARLEEERAAKRRFFAHRASYGSTGSSEHVSTHPEMPQPTPPAVDAVDAPSAPSVNVQSFPSLPKITLRREDTMYSYLYSGREVIVRWDQKGKYISCSCDLLSTSACKGGLPLHRCPTFKSSSSLGALVTQRATVQHNYAAMAGTFSGEKQEARDTLYPGEMQRMENLYEIERSTTPSVAPSVTVTDKGRWDQTLMGFAAWTFESHKTTFPLRVDASWRKTFTWRIKHVQAVQKTFGYHSLQNCIALHNARASSFRSKGPGWWSLDCCISS